MTMTQTEPDKTWTCAGISRLAEIIAGVCRISRYDAGRLAASVSRSPDHEVMFETTSALRAPDLSKGIMRGPVVYWKASQIMTGGPTSGRYRLAMWGEVS